VGLSPSPLRLFCKSLLSFPFLHFLFESQSPLCSPYLSEGVLGLEVQPGDSLHFKPHPVLRNDLTENRGAVMAKLVHLVACFPHKNPGPCSQVCSVHKHLWSNYTGRPSIRHCTYEYLQFMTQPHYLLLGPFFA
jgi:hypothetical protein